MQGIDDGRNKRTGNIANSQADNPGIWLGILEIRYFSFYFRKKVIGLEFQIIGIYGNHLILCNMLLQIENTIKNGNRRPLHEDMIAGLIPLDLQRTAK